MALSLTHLPPTLLSLLFPPDLGTLLSWSRLQEAWFGRFWAVVGPQVRTFAEAKVVPLLQGRVTHGIVPTSDGAEGDETPHPAVSGTVLEIGPGSGMWTSLYTPRYLPHLTKVYGIEPNPAQHPALRAQIAAAGLDDSTYEIVPLGIEDLAASGKVPLGSADCVVTVMCLCSIPEPERHIKELYGYLKPGGRWYVYEHVKCSRKQGWGMGLYQCMLPLSVTATTFQSGTEDTEGGY
jgi:SAM-dependent methyltransferase